VRNSLWWVCVEASWTTNVLSGRGMTDEKCEKPDSQTDLSPKKCHLKSQLIHVRRRMNVKRQFGGLASRLLRGGTTLSDTEYAVMCGLVDALPTELGSIVSAQLNSYNLVQRESDGRALNFYRFKNGSPSFTDDLPHLQMKTEESPLVRAKFSVEGEQEPLHAVLAAVRGRVFCISFSRPPPNSSRSIRVLDTEQSWRSSVVVGSSASNSTPHTDAKLPPF
jgi:hypothetical protein